MTYALNEAAFALMDLYVLKMSTLNLQYLPFIGESLFTLFASLAYVPLFLLEQQNRLF